MTVLQAAAAPTDSAFVSRCSYFAVKAAVAIANEAPSTALHQSRIAMVQKILFDPTGWGTRFSLAAASQPAVLASATLSAVQDADLETAINAVYNAYAGS